MFHERDIVLETLATGRKYQKLKERLQQEKATEEKRQSKKRKWAKIALEKIEAKSDPLSRAKALSRKNQINRHRKAHKTARVKRPEEDELAEDPAGIMSCAIVCCGDIHTVSHCHDLLCTRYSAGTSASQTAHNFWEVGGCDLCAGDWQSQGCSDHADYKKRQGASAKAFSQGRQHSKGLPFQISSHQGQSDLLDKASWPAAMAGPHRQTTEGLLSIVRCHESGSRPNSQGQRLEVNGTWAKSWALERDRAFASMESPRHCSPGGIRHGLTCLVSYIYIYTRIGIWQMQMTWALQTYLYIHI